MFRASELGFRFEVSRRSLHYDCRCSYIGLSVELSLLTLTNTGCRISKIITPTVTLQKLLQERRQLSYLQHGPHSAQTQNVRA